MKPPRGFTLVELLVIIAIMGSMALVSVVSIRAGQGAARIRGASRDIFATIRQARSVALVTQQPAIITYSEREIDGERSVRIEISSTKMVSAKGPTQAKTLSGETVYVGGDGDAAAEPEASGDEAGAAGSGRGETIEDILFAPMADETVKGVRIKVTKGDELLTVEREERQSAKISVFSNVDYLLGKFSEAKEKEAAKKDEEEKKEEPAPAASGELQEPVSIVWEVNGRCEPHRVWVYADGTDPDKGLCIKVDRFGAAKILSGNEE